MNSGTPLSTLLLALSCTLLCACASTTPTPQDLILVEVVSDPEQVPVTYKGEGIGLTPVSVEVPSLEDLLFIEADLGGQAPMERRVQLLSSMHARILLRFGSERSKMIAELGLDRVIIFDYSSRATFDVDEAVLKPELLPLLEEQARVLNAYFAGVPVYVCGHTDSTGGTEHNLELSLARAQVVTDFLSSHGVEAERLQTQGFGEDYPLAGNDDEAGRAQNRRTELVLPQ
jgi:outer membrane protein OmpA-like peptidoglycan-associated protein